MKIPKGGQEVIDFLSKHGPIDDPAGRATAKFREDMDFSGSAAAFTQLIAAMENRGILSRSVRGKRTYRIALSTSNEVIPEGHLEEMTSPIEGELNYDELAAALLSKVVEAISNGSVGGRGDSTRTRRQLERLQRQNEELATELSKARMELKESAIERQDLRERLQNSEGNLALLTDRLVEKPGKAVASSKLSKLKAEDRALLDHLLSGDEVRSNRAT